MQKQKLASSTVRAMREKKQTLENGTQFIVLEKGDVIVHKTISPPSVRATVRLRD